MSSRFVSAGNIEPAANSKEDEWKKAQVRPGTFVRIEGDVWGSTC